jgi:hypothetical protein
MGYEAAIAFDDNWFVGEDKKIRFVVYVDGHGPDDPDPEVENVTGWTIDWVVKVRTSSVAETFRIAAVALDAPHGLVELTIPRNTTKDLKPGTYSHSLVRKDAGFYSELAFGPAVLRKGAA